MDNKQSAAKRHLQFLDRMVIATGAGAALALVGIVCSSVIPNSTQAAQIEQGTGWSIVQYYKGDAFIIDHGLTHDDCDAMLPRNQAAKGLTFACELEA